MNAPPELPDLRIVPTDALYPHEHVDRQRLTPLIDALRTEKLLKNPPVVLPISDHAEKYVVLDGANRTTAFREMGIPHILAQVVHAGAAQVRVETWNHVVMGCDAQRLQESLREALGHELIPSEPTRASTQMRLGGALLCLQLPDGQAWEVRCDGCPLQERVARLSDIVALYQGECRIERVKTNDIRGLPELFPEFCCLVVFDRFEVEEVTRLAADGILFPSGLTRFLVSPRALRVNYPLEWLASSASKEEKQRQAEAWVLRCLQERRVRRYEEETFLFDE